MLAVADDGADGAVAEAADAIILLVGDDDVAIRGERDRGGIVEQRTRRRAIVDGTGGLALRVGGRFRTGAGNGVDDGTLHGDASDALVTGVGEVDVANGIDGEMGGLFVLNGVAGVPHVGESEAGLRTDPQIGTQSPEREALGWGRARQWRGHARLRVSA